MADNESGTARKDSSFWRFSLRFYGLPEVAHACLALQDEAGVDVNLLLYLLFLAESRRTLSRDEIASLDHAIAPWRDEVVKPLRALRRRLKSGVADIPHDTGETFRNLVKRIELEAERIEQQRLEQFGLQATEAPSREAAARANMGAYGAYLGGLPEKPAAIVLAAFIAA
jgi:uncharacterized protein (TIGR02444 family)